MRKLFLLLVCGFVFQTAKTQTNILSTNPVAEQIMLGNYTPATYLPPVIIDHPDSLSKGIREEISPDSLKNYIVRLSQFHNRNTNSDTVSPTIGIGAARRWVHQKFQQFSAANNNRLIPSYLQFDQLICSTYQHRNIFAVLPGSDITDPSVIIVEGHIDSRCEVLCDSLCSAQGVEDNASGTALVMELARVMSKFTFKHTIVFLVVIGEEQGLLGANAFSNYCLQEGITIKAVQNNDVTGGILCGQTSSAPSCPGLGNVDSTGVRFFSFGNFNSKNKQYARFMKLEYTEQILPWVTVPMDIRIMSPEDRTGRSGDHIPFRLDGFTAMRVTSANEHGNANVSDTNYTDRQHTTRDTLGVDTNGDLVIDSFFVDFNYLARNAVINGNAIAMAAQGPLQPDLTLSAYGMNLVVTVLPSGTYDTYRIALRYPNIHDWDTLITLTGALVDTIPVINTGWHIVSVCAVDSLGIESIFSKELQVNVNGTGDELLNDGAELLQNYPNPFDEATYITVMANEKLAGKDAEIVVHDLNGKEIQRMPIHLEPGQNDVLYVHGYGATGYFNYSLVVDGKIIQTKQMVFAN